jgi:hypothetical protein
MPMSSGQIVKLIDRLIKVRFFVKTNLDNTSERNFLPISIKLQT